MKQVGTGAKITCMACDTTQMASVRIAAATREHHVVMWSVEGNLLMPILSVQLSTTVLKGIALHSQVRKAFGSGVCMMD